MKKIISILMATLIFSAIVTMKASAADIGFTDTNGHWAEDTINKWKDEGVITGYPDGTFKPDNPVTRGELAKIITSAFDLQEKSVLEYADLDSSEWYYPYVECADQYIPIYALISSYPNNIPYSNNEWRNDGFKGFLPGVSAIRMHVAEALVKIKIERENLDITLPDMVEMSNSLIAFYKDGGHFNLISGPHGGIPENLQRMIKYGWLAKELDVIRGDANGNFRPYDTVTRTELLTIIDRILS